MGFSHGHSWTDEDLFRLKELLIHGFTITEVADILAKEWGEDITYDQIACRIKAHLGSVTEFLATIDPGIEIYENDTLPLDNYAIWCDEHSPYHSEEWINRGLYMAEHFGIRKLINIGDAFDSNFARYHFLGPDKDLDDEIFHSEPIVKAFNYFDEVYCVKGNHENRLARMTDNILQARHLMELFGVDIARKKFKLSNYDKVYIGDDGKEGWLLVHPQSYSQIKGSVARRLAEKFHRNVINTHGHFVDFEYDRSGNFQVYDLGGMFDVRKTAYINLRTTTHPIWNNGFGILRNGKFWHFTEATDWDYWLAQ